MYYFLLHFHINFITLLHISNLASFLLSNNSSLNPLLSHYSFLYSFILHIPFFLVLNLLILRTCISFTLLYLSTLLLDPTPLSYNLPNYDTHFLYPGRSIHMFHSFNNIIYISHSMAAILTLLLFGLSTMLLTVNIMIHPCKTKNLTDILLSSLLSLALYFTLLSNTDMSPCSPLLDHTSLFYVLLVFHISLVNS